MVSRDNRRRAREFIKPSSSLPISPFTDNHRVWGSPSHGFRIQSASINWIYLTFRKVLLRYSNIRRLSTDCREGWNMNAGSPDDSPDTQETLAGWYEKLGYKLSQTRAGQITMSLLVQNQTSPASVLIKMSRSIVSRLPQALALWICSSSSHPGGHMASSKL